jgi:hypothetical protein
MPAEEKKDKFKKGKGCIDFRSEQSGNNRFQGN